MHLPENLSDVVAFTVVYIQKIPMLTYIVLALTIANAVTEIVFKIRWRTKHRDDGHSRD